MILVILIAIARQFHFKAPFGDGNPVPTSSPPAMSEGDYSIRRVVDGDTLLLADHSRVRLIGVDTPETKKENTPVQPFGPEATHFTEEFLRQHRVRLTFDRERLDQYGRYLAYVWVGDRLLNEELLRAGLARAEMNYHYSSAMKTRFRKAESAARDERLGIWSLPNPPGHGRRRPVGRSDQFD